jgi:hypothetical protein
MQGVAVPDDRIAEALRKAKGRVMTAARSLGVSRQALYNHINVSTELQDIRADYRELLVDKAESALESGLDRGEGWATCFTLKTLGKDRGYVTNEQIAIQANEIRIIEDANWRRPHALPSGNRELPEVVESE